MSRCVEVGGCFVFCFKQKTAYEVRISDWSSDVCSSDLGGAQSGAARRHRIGQDLHHGQGGGGAAAPCPCACPQQDPRRPALWRVQELLSRKCGRIFRQLLRLLSARSLWGPHRHLYREGKLDKRGARQDRKSVVYGKRVSK